jgi:hypothetical protein
VGGCLITIGFTAVAGFVIYLVFYKLISKYKREDLKEPTNNLFRVVGVLVSLVLALSFSEVIVEHKTISNAIQHEAVAIRDIFVVLRLFDFEKIREIQTQLVDYSKAIIDDDWPALADDRLGQRAGVLKTQIAESVINLNLLRGLSTTGTTCRARFPLYDICRFGAVSRFGIERSVSKWLWCCADTV